MNSISFYHHTRQLFLLSILIFTIGNTWGQNNPYQAECAKFDSKPSFQCSAYSNCRMMGGSSDSCQTSSGGNKRFVESEDEIKARKIHEQELRDKPKRDQMQQQQYQQYLQQQYQQNKK